MIEAVCDIFDESVACDARCVTTNGVVDRYGRLVMGKGVALLAKNKFPQWPKILGDETTRCLEPVVHATKFDGCAYHVVSFPTKYHWRDRSDMWLIERSARQLVLLSDSMGWTKVLLPRPGCQNGGLTWTSVRVILNPILDDRFTAVHNGVN